MRLGTILILVIIIVALWFIFRTPAKENFFPNSSLTVHWAPSSISPNSIAYNWGVCISGQPTQSGIGQCLAQNPPYPPGNPGEPGATWTYKGQTAKGVSSLTLDNTNCGMCNTGQTLTLLLQAVNLDVPSAPKSEWAAFTIDLSSKSTLVKSSISDSPNTSVALFPGSTGLSYMIQLNDPVFQEPNDVLLSVNLVRGGTSFSYSTPVSSIVASTDRTTGTYTGSFTTVSTTSPWHTAPGPLQTGDVVTVIISITKPGTSSESGEVLHAGSVSQTVVDVTPPAPTGIIWSLV